MKISYVGYNPEAAFLDSGHAPGFNYEVITTVGDGAVTGYQLRHDTDLNTDTWYVDTQGFGEYYTPVNSEKIPQEIRDGIRLTRNIYLRTPGAEYVWWPDGYEFEALTPDEFRRKYDKRDYRHDD